MGIENKAAQTHPLRSRDNIYEYKDTKPSKSLPDTSSLRSPSSLGITTQSTKAGSQSSLQSGAISLKESPVTPTPKDGSDKSYKFSERSISTHPKGKYDDSRNLLSTYEKSREALSSSPAESKTSVTPVPTARKTIKTSRTHLIEGVPQTEV